MTRTYTNRRYLDALQQRVLVFDGAMGTSLQAQKLTAAHFGGEQYNGCNDYLVISFPEAVEKVHRSFLEVGVDVVETDTFRSNRITLGEYGLGDRVFEINHTAASLARRLADEYSSIQQLRFVAGSIGPTGKLPSADDSELSNVTFDELALVFSEQALGLIHGGADLLLVETSQDILEVKAAVVGLRQAFAQSGIILPLQVQVTLDTTGRMLLGTDIAAALAILEGLEIDVIGLNCSTGPEHMREPVRYLGEFSHLPTSCIPNAGLPLNVDGEAIYPLEPQPFAQALFDFVEQNNIRVVGGCCGTTPAHLKQLVEMLGNSAAARASRPGFVPAGLIPRLASATQAQPMHQEPPPLLIGERCNSQGSRKFKRLLLEENFDAILELARQQVEGGAHALDISVAVTERADEIELMRRVVKKLASGVESPLVIDTTEPDVMEAALKIAPGRCLLNSTHLESGREKADRVFDIARRFNAAVLVLTIDERGMAKTAQEKLSVARRIHDIAVQEHGLTPDALVFDTLTFTLATGDPEFSDSAIATLDGIRLIKEQLPGVLTSLGVSNISFGLDPVARPVLNSVMLYHAVQAGLDMAIVNPAHITPYAEIPLEQRQLAEDLIFNRQPDALQGLIEFYGSAGTGAFQTESTTSDPTEGMTPSQRLQWRVLHRHKEGVEADIDAILAEDGRVSRHETAVHILNQVLLPAMKEVGDRFGAGELILPFVLQSAEVMKKAVAHVEKYLERKEGTSKGTVVLATVYGDVHDIGKNLVKTILSNNGYAVIDLGKQVPAEVIISRAEQEQADAIGLSALLVNTSKQMPLIVNELQRRGLKFPVLVGGAAINRRFGWRILLTDSGQPYAPGVFYCKDAFEGLEVMEALTDSQQRLKLLERLHSEAENERARSLSPGSQSTSSQGKPALPSILASKRQLDIPVPPAWGPRLVSHMPLEIVFKHISTNELFRLSWGAKNFHGEEWDRLKAEFEARLDRMRRQALKEGWLKPQGVYGYWACQSQGEDLILYDAEAADLRSIAARFTFPRQPSGDRLCLADYFAPVDSGILDIVALQVVTVGQGATDRFDSLQAAGDITEAYFSHGLAVQTAEATAEYLHRHIRRELGLPAGRGKRYSWGYPSVPDLEHHRLVFDLLPAERDLGMSLTSAFQIIPEQSTAALIVHHPAAKYFTIGESRLEQLTK
ncbi:MAG: methionine synthase [Chloroflexi bacterium RBG_16_54_18]|nr:MAG: methionine synthase [Chloroflexi bacterium RBG_16_54_18]